MKDNIIKMNGTVKKVLPNTRFCLVLDNGVDVEGYIGGKLRQYYIKILRGDRVQVEISPYDLSKARIVYRFKNNVDENKQKQNSNLENNIDNNKNSEKG